MSHQKLMGRKALHRARVLGTKTGFTNITLTLDGTDGICFARIRRLLKSESFADECEMGVYGELSDLLQLMRLLREGLPPLKALNYNSRLSEYERKGEYILEMFGEKKGLPKDSGIVCKNAEPTTTAKPTTKAKPSREPQKKGSWRARKVKSAVAEQQVGRTFLRARVVTASSAVCFNQYHREGTANIIEWLEEAGFSAQDEVWESKQRDVDLAPVARSINAGQDPRKMTELKTVGTVYQGNSYLVVQRIVLV